MTAADLLVYGKPVGSMWDRPAGGRYRLTEIVDNGGLGLWVTLLREDRDEQRMMSVSHLGRDFVAVPEPVDLTGTRRDFDGRICTVESQASDGRWPVTYPDGRRCRVPTDDVAYWTRVPEKAEPAEDEQPKPWTFDAILEFGYHVTLNGVTYFVVDADGKAILEPEPAPSPPLPWEQHPGALWQHTTGGTPIHSAAFASVAEPDPTCWQRVAVIPWDLIEDLRGVAWADPARAILDAADGVTS